MVPKTINPLREKIVITEFAGHGDGGRLRGHPQGRPLAGSTLPGSAALVCRGPLGRKKGVRS